ncbi:MAG TPA: hypothetical protein VF167_17835 [Longimicrobiaceae bacterium]
MKRLYPGSFLLPLCILLLACGGDTPASGDSARGAATAVAGDTGPSAGDLEFAQITASWSEEALEGCGRALREALGTRDLVQGALDNVKDPRGRATAEIEDARYWFGLGTAKIEEVKPRLTQGECAGDITLALDEAVQFFVKAGTAAVQAGQIVAS